MGIWDLQVTRFYAMGIEIDPHDLRIMQDGGEVLHLHHLLAPEWAGGYRYDRAFDQNRDPVWVPEILNVEEPTETVFEYFEEEYGDMWRRYPSFLGTVDDRYHCEDRTLAGRMEAVFFYRFWNCNSFPFREIAEEMCDASDRRLQASRHYEMERVYDFEEGGDYGIDLGLLWASRNDKERLTQSDWEEVERFLYFDRDETDEDRLEVALGDYETCLKEGFLTPTNPTKEEYAALRPLYYPPMSDFLTPTLNRWWEEMLARQQYIRYRVMERMTPSEKYRFDYDEEAE